jgi:hypothetical protein
METDLITMQCPNCGGRLQFRKNTTTLRCENCGIEHIVKQGVNGITLESYAKCPICNRNDKAEKVSSIIRSQIKETESVSYQTKITYKQVGNKLQPFEEKIAVPVKTIQKSDLAKQLTPPNRPQMIPQSNPSVNSFNWGYISSVLLFAIGGFFLISGCFCGFTPLFSEKIDAAGILTALFFAFIGFVIAVLPIIGGVLVITYLVPKEKERINKERIDVEEKKNNYKIEVERINKIWERAASRYESLYYCQRDDCVFVQGENKSAPINRMKEYLFE